jgi:uncharacterized oligopeptide transporter (OPT) family protein
MYYFVDLSVFKLIQVLLISGIKFLFAPLISMGYGFNFFQTVLFTAIGGILGILFFYFLSKWLILQYNKYCPVIFSYFTGERVDRAKKFLRCQEINKKRFSHKSRRIINLRNKYGLLGIVLLTPVLFSIPIGAFLARRYYSKNTNVLVYMSLSVVVWSFFISGVIFLF